ncbi:MAG: N-acetyltransferase [Sphingomonadales bacterium CG12_big_fil_rev_8_21_14_0_65_65_10]|nr:MAG: N-acetyltransferase [Sphingomonadales bacterium CG12_big_fil_rev_8_21_14_0_65_65_10]
MAGEISIQPVSGKRDLAAFIDCAYRLNASDPNWVAPLRSEMRELLTPGKNPFFDHARVQFFLARRGGEVVGRISAHIDELALAQPPEQGMGPGTGNWGLFEAVDEAVGVALIRRAEQWLREQGMTRVLAPLSMSVWEEPGLLVKGHDHAPTVMMGHDDARYQAWIEGLEYHRAKSLLTYELDITQDFPPLLQRIIASGERNEKIRIRKVDKRHFERDAAIIMGILNDAWSDNWGFVPFTEAEIAYAGKKLKPLVFEDLIMIAELEGEPVAFMMTLPDANEAIAPLKGSLWPFGWLKMLRWLRRPRVTTMRVPLMGVLKRLQSSRMASQLAFMMIEYIRRNSIANYGATRGEIGWILEDNKGMIAIAEAIDSFVNREYVIYEKSL